MELWRPRLWTPWERPATRRRRLDPARLGRKLAIGDIMLDASGNIILDASGNIMLDDGAGNACCCGCACSDSPAVMVVDAYTDGLIDPSTCPAGYDFDSPDAGASTWDGTLDTTIFTLEYAGAKSDCNYWRMDGQVSAGYRPAMAGYHFGGITATFDLAHCLYELIISVWSPSGFATNQVPVWYGQKSGGSGPLGTYTRAALDPVYAWGSNTTDATCADGPTSLTLVLP